MLGTLTPVQKPRTKEDFIANALIRGDTWESIQRNLHCGADRISNVNQSLKTTKMPPQPKHPGRPTKITPMLTIAIQQFTSSDPRLGARRLSHHLLQEFNLSASRQTINTIRHLLHFRFSSPRRRPLLTDVQKQKRLTFCEEALSGSIEWKGGGVVISDESCFCLHSDTRRAWIQRGVYTDKNFHSTPKYSSGFMVWGCVGLGFKSELIFVDGTLNGEGYRQMLAENQIIAENVPK
jgi:hypothetical protein